jgi:hypothetical protein
LLSVTILAQSFNAQSTLLHIVLVLFSDVAMMPAHMFTLVDYCQLTVRQMREDGVPGNVGVAFDVLEETMKELKDELNSHDSAVRREADGIAALKKLKKKRKLAADKKAGKLDRLAPMSPRPPVFPPPMHSLLDNGYAFEQAVHIHREHRDRLKSWLAPPPEPAPSTIAAPSQPAWSGERPKAARNIGFVHMCLCEAAMSAAVCICAHETPLQFMSWKIEKSALQFLLLGHYSCFTDP